MLKHLITSKTRRKLLAAFLSNPGSRFYVRELARNTGEQVNAVRRELAKLGSIGLVTKENVGNLLFYKANPGCLIYEELKQIVIKTEGVGALLKKSFAGLKGVRFAFVYGSVARGTEVAGSDVDLFIIGSPAQDKLIRIIRPVERKLGREVNYSIYPEREFAKKRKAGSGFLKEVLRGRKLMIAGDESELERFAERESHQENQS